MRPFSIWCQGGAVGEVRWMLDAFGNSTFDWRDAYVVTAFFPDAEPQWRNLQVTPDHCAYTLTTLH